MQENIHHTVRVEPQSKYYQQVSNTLYMVVLRFHLDDVNHIDDEEKAEVRAAFDVAELPHVIVETHASAYRVAAFAPCTHICICACTLVSLNLK